VSIGNNVGTVPPVSQIIGFAAYFMPYFLIPLTFKFAGGAMRVLGGTVNDRSRGGFDRLKKMRGNTMARLHQDRVAGKTWLGSGRTGSVYRRGALLSTPNSGALSPTTRGRAKFRAAQQNILNRTAAEALKNDDGRASGDDIANTLAQRSGMNSTRFLNGYAESALASGQASTETEARRQAQGALATLQSSYGTDIGSSAMQVAAFKARVASVTGYGESDASKQELFEDAGSMVRQGLITSTDAMSAIKQNKGRIDQSGISFGQGVAAISRAADANGGRTVGRTIAQTDVDGLMNSVMDGLTPGSLIGARRESAVALARHHKRALDEAYTASGGNINDVRVKQQVAHIAGIQDTINSQAPQMARAFRDGIMTEQIGTSGVRVRDHSDALRAADDVDFNDIRKEWLRGSVPPGTTPGAGGSPPSDRRLKRNVVALTKSESGITLYRFQYLWSDQEYVGVMAQDLTESHPNALSTDSNGYYRVNYAALGMRMMTIEEWETEQAQTVAR
jgi:hypothetical protein